ncbi:hypothetical protein [Bacillus sp. HMSC036E02]|nr:hypothetical protein [Bacillus sp. HMSC036E02]OHO73046.1 hypothetical protein HMPREF2590_03530 [Bacillus sp. HMSC036E02]
MERKVKKMMADLQFIMNHGQISVDFMDQGYKRMLFSALEATGKRFNVHTNEHNASLSRPKSKKYLKYHDPNILHMTNMLGSFILGNEF